MEESDISLLVVILDTNPSQKIIRKNAHAMTSMVEAACSFGNAHLMQKSQNKLAVIACHHSAT